MKKKKIRKIQVTQAFVDAFNNASFNDIKKVEEVTSLEQSYSDQDNLNENQFHEEDLPYGIY
jgi:hypothetical protein